MSVKIVYNNVAVYSKSKLDIMNQSDEQTFCDNTMFEVSNRTPTKTGSFDRQYMKCGESYDFFNSSTVAGFQSTDISDSDGNFLPVPYIEFIINDTITSSGITLSFDVHKWIYCKKIRLTWTLASGSTTQKTFYPDSNVYFCEKLVENYTKVKVEFLQTATPQQYARLYKIDFGETIEYSADENNLISAELDVSANLVTDELALNTSKYTIIGNDIDGFQKKQRFDIFHNDTYLSSHYTDDIIVKGKTVDIEGTDRLGCVSSYIYTTVNYTELPFESWINMYYVDLYNGIIPPIIDVDIKSKIICGKIDERISKRTFLQELCFAAGAYVDTVSDENIIIRSTSSALSAGCIETVPETQVFEGDSIELKSAYKYLILRWTDENDVEQSVSATNSNCGDSTATKDFTMRLYPKTKINDLLNTYKQYYFKNRFYNAKAVVGYSRIGAVVKINGITANSISRKYILDGDKLIADGVYKCI